MALRSRRAAPLTLGQLAEIVGGELHGDASRRVSGAAEIEDAGSDDLIFCAETRRSAALATTSAAVALLPPGLQPEIEASALNVIRVADPHVAAARALEALYPLEHAAPGVHASATVGDGVALGEGVSIGPQAVIGEGARIGAGTEIGAGCSVGPAVIIGRRCLLMANVSVYDGTEIGDRVVLHCGVVIGADGFGYAGIGAERVKVPQMGGVLIEDEVEIGANACVDRGTFRNTRIGRGSKIDNLVQIGHNCDIGAHCAVSGLAGLSGSTVLEEGVILGGNVGTAGHQVIGAGSMVAAKSGVHGDLPPGSIVGGYPHLDVRLWRRVVASLPKLPELIRRVRRLERAAQEPQE